MNYQRFDDFYLTICKELGGIDQFVNSFFDFLSRKTDFFYESFPGDKMGFPPGYNKQLVFKIMEKYQQEHYKRFPQKSVEQFNQKVEAAKHANKQLKQQEQMKPQQEKPQQITSISGKTTEGSLKEVQSEQSKGEPQKKEVTSQPIVSTYNGGKNDKYSWSQEIREVEVSIEIDPSLTAKTVKVELKPTFISIRKNTGELIVEGQLVEKINTGDSVWKIERTGKQAFMTLNLEKAQEKIWGTVFKGDPEIDTSKVNNTKPLQDFDEETQGAIRKIMYEQQRKQMGLPTSEQEQQLQALKQAWDAQGSPFKGQPFDPSKINMGNQQFPRP